MHTNPHKSIFRLSIVSCIFIIIFVLFSCKSEKLRSLPPPSFDMLKGRSKTSLLSIEDEIWDEKNEFYETLEKQERKALFEKLKVILIKDTGFVDTHETFDDKSFDIIISTKMFRFVDRFIVSCTLGIIIIQPNNEEGLGRPQVIWYKTATRDYDDIKEKGMLELELARELIQELKAHKVIP